MFSLLCLYVSMYICFAFLVVQWYKLYKLLCGNNLNAHSEVLLYHFLSVTRRKVNYPFFTFYPMSLNREKIKVLESSSGTSDGLSRFEREQRAQSALRLEAAWAAFGPDEAAWGWFRPAEWFEFVGLASARNRGL